jgi:hypothetical protein
LEHSNRGEANGIRSDVRERLGWATEPEFAFDSAHQCMTLSLMHYWVCFQRGPRGEILRLHPDSTAQGGLFGRNGRTVCRGHPDRLRDGPG